MKHLSKIAATPPLASAAVFLGTIALILLFWAILPESYRVNESTDYTGFYEPVAMNLIQGKGLSLHGELATRYPPGYPMILAGAFQIADWTNISHSNATTILA